VGRDPGRLRSTGPGMMGIVVFGYWWDSVSMMLRSVWSVRGDIPRAVLNRPLPGDLSFCDYYRGVGVCDGSEGCASAGEPRCVTEQPVGGWPSERGLWGRLRWLVTGE